MNEYVENSKTKHPHLWMGDLKKCSKCGEYKAADRYIIDKRRSLPVGQCYDCKKEKDKRYRDNMSEERKEAMRQHHREYQATDKYRETIKQWRINSALSSDIYFRQCEICSKSIIHRKENKSSVCVTCRNRMASRVHYAKYKASSRPVGSLDNCLMCDTEYRITASGVQRYCPSCSAANRKVYKRNDKRKRRNAKRIAGVVEQVIDIKVFNRDKWKCRSCGCKVQKQDINAGNAAELDHIMPIAKGGVETYSNVQTLCRNCNQVKRDRLVGQLVLMI